MDLKNRLLEDIKKLTGLNNINLEVPPHPSMGEYSLPCFKLGNDPNKEAIDYYGKVLRNPVINDVGYVVVILKRVEREKDMPDSIKVNLTGVLRYNAENFFGTGQSHYYLSTTDSDEWDLGDNYKENSFFIGETCSHWGEDV